MKTQKKRKTFKVKLKCSSTHIALVHFTSPMMKQLAAAMLPPGALILHTEGGAETWAFRTTGPHQLLAYCDDAGNELVTMRVIPENSVEWQRLWAMRKVATGV